jgi:hypothetical protein
MIDGGDFVRQALRRRGVRGGMLHPTDSPTIFVAGSARLFSMRASSQSLTAAASCSAWSSAGRRALRITERSSATLPQHVSHAVVALFDFVQSLVALRRCIKQLGELRRDPFRATAPSGKSASPRAMAVAGSCYPAGACASVRRLFVQVGPRVRIRLAPAGSLVRTRSRFNVNHRPIGQSVPEST